MQAFHVAREGRKEKPQFKNNVKSKSSTEIPPCNLASDFSGQRPSKSAVIVDLSLTEMLDSKK